MNINAKFFKGKSVAFLYPRNEYVGFEISNTMWFTLVPPEMKYLHVTLTKYVQDLYEINIKIQILLYEIK